MKRCLAITVLVIMAGFFGQQAMSQTYKFGHVNRNDLIQSMPEFDSARVNLEKLNKELSNQLELLQVEYNNKAEAYVKESKNLTDLVRQTKEQELQDFQTRMQTFQQSASTQLQEKQTTLFNPITEKADKAIKEVGKENGFFYIFDLSGGQVAYFDETKSVNVMPLVKTKLGLK